MKGLRFEAAVPRADFLLDISVEASPGEVTAVVGPNGSGKSTLLRAVAGLEPISRGCVLLDGRVLDDGERIFVPPEHRRIGVVFQDYLLFPHLTVQDNVAFGPRAQGLSAKAARAIAQRWLTDFGLLDLAHRRPSHISGGQAQRVALVRALAAEPAALLLDEPLAALDAGARATLRGEIGGRLRGFTGVTLLVTHEPLEALVLADRIIVIEGGRIVQQGSVAEVAARPASAYVAALMGVNLLRGRSNGDRVIVDGGGELIAACAVQGRVFATIRPSAITVHRTRPEGSARNVWPAAVRTLEEVGDRVRVGFDGRPPLLVDLTAASVAGLALAPGVDAWLSVKATEIDVYPETGRVIGS